MKTFSSLSLALVIFMVCRVQSNEHTAEQERREFHKRQFVYDVNDYKPVRNGNGGRIYEVSQAEWPVLEDQGVSMARFNLEPCGLVQIHEHPRASEILYVNKGSEIVVGFFEEDGGRLISNTIKEGLVTLFPEALMHFIWNSKCEDAELIGFFSNEDPGFVSVGAESFKFPTNAVASVFGMDEEYVEKVKKGTPFNPVQASHECRKRCKYGKGYEKEKRSYGYKKENKHYRAEKEDMPYEAETEKKAYKAVRRNYNDDK